MGAGNSAATVVDGLVTLVVLLALVWLVADALEAAPVLDFETQADDAIEGTVPEGWV
jgi:hypothetical protein